MESYSPYERPTVPAVPASYANQNTPFVTRPVRHHTGTDATTSYQPSMASSVIPSPQQPRPINRGLGQGFEPGTKNLPSSYGGPVMRPVTTQPATTQPSQVGATAAPSSANQGPIGMDKSVPHYPSTGVAAPYNPDSYHPSANQPPAEQGHQLKGVQMTERTAYAIWQAHGRDFNKFSQIMQEHYGVSPQETERMHKTFMITPDANPETHKQYSAGSLGGDPSLSRAGRYVTPNGTYDVDQNLGNPTKISGPAAYMQPGPVGSDALPEDKNVGTFAPAPKYQPGDDSPIERQLYQERTAAKAEADHQAAPARGAAYRQHQQDINDAQYAAHPEQVAQQFQTDQVKQLQGQPSTAEKVATINAKGKVDAATATAQGRSQRSPAAPADTESGKTDRLNKSLDVRRTQIEAQRDRYDQSVFNTIVSGYQKDGADRNSAVAKALTEFNQLHGYEYGKRPPLKGNPQSGSKGRLADHPELIPQYLAKAGGDPAKAKALAEADGWDHSQ